MIRLTGGDEYFMILLYISLHKQTTEQNVKFL